MAASFSASPELLLERYGVRAHRVFGSRPSSGCNALASARGQSASSLGSRPRAPATAPPLAGRHWGGSHSAGSLCSSARSGFDPDNPHSTGEFRGSAGGALSSTCAPLTNVNAGAGGTRETGAESGVAEPKQVSAFSVGELRALFAKPRARKGVPPLAPGSMKKPRNRGHSPQAANVDSSASTPQLSMCRAAVRGRNRPVRSLAVLRKPKARYKDSCERQTSIEDATGSGEEGFEFDQGSDDAEEDGADGAALGGKAFQKVGKRGARFNPFVEFEDREQRLMCERRWLKDDDHYMRERMRGMRLDSVQAHLDKVSLSVDELYQDAVLFSGYACDLRARQSQKADLSRQSSPSLPAVRTHASQGPAGSSSRTEAEQGFRNKKGQGEKSVLTKSTMSLKSMQATLQDSTLFSDYFSKPVEQPVEKPVVSNPLDGLCTRGTMYRRDL